jgi:hypothetical protein
MGSRAWASLNHAQVINTVAVLGRRPVFPQDAPPSLVVGPLPAGLPARPPVRPSVCLSACLPACLSVCPLVRTSICLTLSGVHLSTHGFWFCQALAEQCWAAALEDRPTFAEITSKLKEMKDNVQATPADADT